MEKTVKNLTILNHKVNGFEIIIKISNKYLCYTLLDNAKTQLSKLEIDIESSKILSFNCTNTNIYKHILVNSLAEEDKGLNDQFLYTCLAIKFKDKKEILRLPHYFLNGYSEYAPDYFDSIKPSKEVFLEFLGLKNLQDGLIVVPVTVKDHFSTLFIDLKNDKMLLFDSGLGHCEEKMELNTEEIEEDEEILKLKNPVASKYVFGKNLAKDIICLNNYCLQDEQSCGYWTIVACELGASEEYNDIDKIIKDCNNGIFQIKLAKRVLEITDDIVNGNKQDIILINPAIDYSFNKNEYTEYKKDNNIIFIKNIDSKNIIGVDLDLLKEQMKEKRFVEASIQLQPDITQIKPISRSSSYSILQPLLQANVKQIQVIQPFKHCSIDDNVVGTKTNQPLININNAKPKSHEI